MYKKIYNSKTEYQISVLENGYYKPVIEGENSPKVIKWLNEGNQFEVIEWVAPDLATTKKDLLEQAKSLVSSKLQETDWKVLRQYERITAKKASKILTDDEFIAFSEERQALRDKMNDYEIAIENANSYDEVINIELGI